MWQQQVSSHYLNGYLPYVRRQLYVLSVSLNKNISFLPFRKERDVAPW